MRERVYEISQGLYILAHRLSPKLLPGRLQSYLFGSLP